MRDHRRASDLLHEARSQRALHALEEVSHRVGIEPCFRERADADPVRFGLVLAREVDLHLLEDALHRGHRADIGVAGAVGVLVRGRGDRADHRENHQRGHLLLGLDGANQVILCDVRDFVREYRRELVLGLRRRDQARIDADETARQRERVDLRVAHDEECESLVGLRTVRDELVAERVEIVREQRIVQHAVLVAQLMQDIETILALLLGRSDLPGRAAEIGQAHLAAERTARQHRDCGEQRDEKELVQNHSWARCIASKTTLLLAQFHGQRANSFAQPAFGLRRRECRHWEAWALEIAPDRPHSVASPRSDHDSNSP